MKSANPRARLACCRPTLSHAAAAETSVPDLTQRKEDQEKSDAWWMDDGTRTFLFKCMQLESSAVLTIDRDHHEHMTCRQVRTAQTGSIRNPPRAALQCGDGLRCRGHSQCIGM